MMGLRRLHAAFLLAGCASALAGAVVQLRAQEPDYTLAYPGMGSCEVLRGEKSWATRLIISAHAPLFVAPGLLPTPMVLLNPGQVVDVVSGEGEFFLVRYDPQGVRRPAYIHCAQAYPSPGWNGADPRRSMATGRGPTSATPAPPAAEDRSAAADRSRSPDVAAPRTERETLHGYAEWRRGDAFIVDGQRVRWNDATRWENVRAPSDVRIGYEVTATGVRAPDGSLLASRLSAKPNGAATFESATVSLTNRVEAQWLTVGELRQPAPDGSVRSLGRIVEQGPEVDRARRLISRLIPPYVDAARLRVRVVQTKGWNAMAMANGAIWVFQGLLDDTSDDELASVLGHELAHFTHEHNRRNQRTSALGSLVDLLARSAIGKVSSPSLASALDVGRVYGLAAWQNGYSRDLEDQADRVGVRYAFEAGFDVTAAPAMWRRMLAREGQFDPVTNFFLGDHSRPSDRVKNLEREIRLNYQH